MLHYLQDALLDKAVLCLGTVDPLGDDSRAPGAPAERADEVVAPFQPLPGSTMSLDGAALQNLEVRCPHLRL